MVIGVLCPNWGLLWPNWGPLQVRALLAELDPEVPLFLGSTRFGLQPLAGSQAQLTRMVQRGEFFREAAKHSMCHGGSGYVVSRGLLRLLRPHLQRCVRHRPPFLLTISCAFLSARPPNTRRVLCSTW